MPHVKKSIFTVGISPRIVLRQLFFGKKIFAVLNASVKLDVDVGKLDV